MCVCVNIEYRCTYDGTQRNHIDVCCFLCVHCILEVWFIRFAFAFWQLLLHCLCGGCSDGGAGGAHPIASSEHRTGSLSAESTTITQSQFRLCWALSTKRRSPFSFIRSLANATPTTSGEGRCFPQPTHNIFYILS